MTDQRRYSKPSRSPKDTFITVYGRMPVLSVLQDSALQVDKLVIADNARGDNLDRIRNLATRRGIPVRSAPAQRVKLLAGNGKHDQGVIADVVAPRMRTIEEFVERGKSGRLRGSGVLALDGVTNPSNVGMILRTATAAGMAGVVLPRAGSPDVDALVIKASAGVAFHAPIVRCGTAAEGLEALKRAGYRIFGLSGTSRGSLYEKKFPANSVFVLGNETEGVSAAVERLVDEWISIPMAGGVESLNVSSAAAVLCFELVRRRQPQQSTKR